MFQKIAFPPTLKSFAVFHLKFNYAVISVYQMICKSLQVLALFPQFIAFQSVQLNKCLYMHKYILCYIVRTSEIISFMCTHFWICAHVHSCSIKYMSASWLARKYSHIVFIYWWCHLLVTVKIKSLLYAYRSQNSLMLTCL